MEERRYSSTILELSTRWGSVVSFTPRSLYLRVNRPRYPLDRRLVEAQSQSRRCGEEKNLELDGIRTRAVKPVAIPTEFATHTEPFIIAIMEFLSMLRFAKFQPQGSL
jgi:hypothetical protein